MTTADKSRGLEGEVFYPAGQIITETRVKDGAVLPEKARKDLRSFWEAEANELE